MRSHFFSLLTICLFIILPQAPSLSQTRLWKNSGQDNGAVHSLGNGKMCVYEQGPDVIKIYSAPYSTPSLLQMSLQMEKPVQIRSTREPGAAIWTHNIFLNGKKTGAIVDYVDAEIPCFIRHIQTDAPIYFKLALQKVVHVIDNSHRFDAKKQQGGLLLQTAPGARIYQTYTFPGVMFQQMAWQGAVSVEQAPDNKQNYTIRIGPGESNLYFIGGPEYPQTVTHTEMALSLSHADMLPRTRAYWQRFTKRRIDFRQKLLDNVPQRQKLLQVIDDVSVMIKTQQSAEGAVMAGYPYPLGYVRDQFGVARGLLALGYHQEAKSILNFYWRIWQRYGKIHNAQAIGVDGIFHIHENDEVEITGYLILQAFDLFEKTGDAEFISTIFPMLEWAWEAQKKNLVDGMLPFNGDETYIAGGILPRSTLNDGSAEATMLFIAGGGKLLHWVKKHDLWTANVLAANAEILQETKQRYRQNFWRDGQLLTNNPKRAQQIKLPRFRHGVCERFQENKDCEMNRLGGICWTERNENNRYLCPACLALGPYPAVAPKVYDLISVSLLPLWFHSSLFQQKELAPLVNQIVRNYRETGSLHSRQDNAGAASRLVGYDYGLLLYVLTEMNHPAADKLYQKTLSIVDPVGAWAEYYIDDKPQGTRCRPWESAINLEALLTNAIRWSDSR